MSDLRIGKLIALDEDDVHEDYIDIDQNYGLTTDEIKSFKTNTSYRQVHLQPQLKECLAGLTMTFSPQF